MIKTAGDSPSHNSYWLSICEHCHKLTPSCRVCSTASHLESVLYSLRLIVPPYWQAYYASVRMCSENLGRTPGKLEAVTNITWPIQSSNLQAYPHAHSREGYFPTYNPECIDPSNAFPVVVPCTFAQH